MFFLCTPISFEDIGVGWLAVWMTIILFSLIVHPIFFYFFRKYVKDGKISEEILNRIKYEKLICWAILGPFGLAAPMCAIFFILPLFVMIVSPFYFTFSFLTTLILEKLHSSFERKLLLFYYAIPTFSIIILGVILKLRLYGNLSELIFYYTNDHTKVFSILFVSFLFLFVIYFYLFGSVSLKKE
ncbi:MAG: hypothetical protein NZM44_00990 [Candidatus Calescibacterium sp.]|nr:hypothetical protein [Candidatus Calescibacterium sp.]